MSQIPAAAASPPHSRNVRRARGLIDRRCQSLCEDADQRDGRQRIERHVEHLHRTHVEFMRGREEPPEKKPDHIDRKPKADGRQTRGCFVAHVWFPNRERLNHAPRRLVLRDEAARAATYAPARA